MSKGPIRQIGATLGSALALALTLAYPAAAHHSFAVYDMVSKKSAEGTIKEFAFGAPHSTLRFIVKGADGKPHDLTLIGAAPGALRKAGFKPQDFSKGTKVQVTYHPVKNGAPEGAMLSITLPDGRVFMDQEVRGGGGAPPAGAAAGTGGSPGGAPGAAGPQ